jgi:transcriptional regulator with XRE-family HTH domain
MEQIHEKIRRIRKESGLPQKAVAEKAGISPAHLHDIETARRNPSTETINAIARTFNMTLDELLADVVLYRWDKPWKLIPQDEYTEMILEE